MNFVTIKVTKEQIIQKAAEVMYGKDDFSQREIATVTRFIDGKKKYTIADGNVIWVWEDGKTDVDIRPRLSVESFMEKFNKFGEQHKDVDFSLFCCPDQDWENTGSGK